MEIGLLVLRLLLGGLLFGHAAQKLFGWFRGHGPDGTGTVFETWGFRPGKPLVVLAALCELTAAASMVTGLLIPLGAAIALGTMLVAGSVNVHGSPSPVVTWPSRRLVRRNSAISRAAPSAN
ncbi:DoxX family protein [Streptomyces uncialis]|uniref:DoxX family protein n=1 Tax=Streptomyces uncialis TaxID=1048205 RepID=UPI002250DC62|nr:DoxX family protein [Streptomyces uncialis]MCX4658283.1 DoxX family protein [Streptomyces uncialis]